MSGGAHRVRLLERRFTAEVPVERAWEHLARVEQWPSWAQHLRQVRLHPTGRLGPDSEGAIVLTNGIRPTFRMAEFDEGCRWKWVGPFLWLTVHYDQRFERVDSETCAVSFVLDGEGFGAALFGRLFAAIYARNLDRAIPNLIGELERC